MDIPPWKCTSSFHLNFSLVIFHLSEQLSLLRLQKLPCWKAREEPFNMAKAPMSCKNLAITAFEWKTVKTLNRATDRTQNPAHHLIQIPSLVASPPDFCLSYRNLTAIKYAPCTLSGTIPLPHTSLRRGPGSEVTCWVDQRLELQSAAKEAWQT